MAVIIINPSDIYEISGKKILLDNKIDNVNYSINTISASNNKVEINTMTSQLMEIDETITSSSNISDIVTELPVPDDTGMVVSQVIGEYSTSNKTYGRYAKGNIVVNLSLDFNFIKGKKIKVYRNIEKFYYYKYDTNKKVWNYLEEPPYIDDADHSIGRYPKNQKIKIYDGEMTEELAKTKSLTINDKITIYDYFFEDIFICAYNLSYTLETTSFENEVIDYSSSTNGYSYDYNELMQDKDFIISNTNSIIEKWNKGKHTIHLKIKYGKYNDIDGGIVYNGYDGNIIKVGDVVRPMQYKSGRLSPIFINNSLPVDLKVISSELHYEGYAYIELDLIEL